MSGIAETGRRMTGGIVETDDEWIEGQSGGGVTGVTGVKGETVGREGRDRWLGFDVVLLALHIRQSYYVLSGVTGWNRA